MVGRFGITLTSHRTSYVPKDFRGNDEQFSRWISWAMLIKSSESARSAQRSGTMRGELSGKRGLSGVRTNKEHGIWIEGAECTIDHPRYKPIKIFRCSRLSLRRQSEMGRYIDGRHKRGRR